MAGWVVGGRVGEVRWLCGLHEGVLTGVCFAAAAVATLLLHYPHNWPCRPLLPACLLCIACRMRGCSWMRSPRQSWWTSTRTPT